MDAEKYKEKLQERLKELIKREDDIEEQFESSADSPFDGDASATGQLDVQEDLDEMGASEARAIYAALDRIEAGTYGDCVTCGEMIDPQRLELLPHTPFCQEHAP